MVVLDDIDRVDAMEERWNGRRRVLLEIVRKWKQETGFQNMDKRNIATTKLRVISILQRQRTLQLCSSYLVLLGTSNRGTSTCSDQESDELLQHIDLSLVGVWCC